MPVRGELPDVLVDSGDKINPNVTIRIPSHWSGLIFRFKKTKEKRALQIATELKAT